MMVLFSNRHRAWIDLCRPVLEFRMLIHRDRSYPIADDAFFVQVIDTSRKPRKSSKLPQCEFLEPSIQTFLRAANKRMHYDMFYGGVSQFASPADQGELLAHIRNAIVS